MTAVYWIVHAVQPDAQQDSAISMQKWFERNNDAFDAEAVQCGYGIYAAFTSQFIPMLYLAAVQ